MWQITRTTSTNHKLIHFITEIPFPKGDLNCRPVLHLLQPAFLLHSYRKLKAKSLKTQGYTLECLVYNNYQNQITQSVHVMHQLQRMFNSYYRTLFKCNQPVLANFIPVHRHLPIQRIYVATRRCNFTDDGFWQKLLCTFLSLS